MIQEAFDIICNDNSKTFICYHDPSGNFLFVSNSSKTILGFDPEELIGTNSYDYIHPKDQEYVEKVLHFPSLDGKIDAIGEYRFRKKNGDYIWFRTETKLLKDSNNIVIHILSISTDITELVSLKHELVKQKMLFDETGKMAKIGAWELELDPINLRWSKEIYDIYEVDYTYNPIYNDIMTFFPGEAREMLELAINNAKQGIPYDLVLPFITAKENKIWVRAMGKPYMELGKIIKLFGVFQDITKEVITRNKLNLMIDQLTNQKKQLENFNETLSQNIRTPFTKLNTLLNNYEMANDEAEKEKILSNLISLSKSLNEFLDKLVDSTTMLQ